jgi:opacity protein-like surface antigen
MNVVQDGAIGFWGHKVKIAATALAITAVLCLSATAQPRQRPPQPGHFYVFGEYDHYTDSSKLRGGGAGLGWNFNRYVGLQAGAQFLNSSATNIDNSGVDGIANTTVVYGEAKLSLPLTDSFSLYGTGGLAYGDTTADYTFSPYTFSESKNAIGYRVGVGAEYWITRHIGLRASWHQIDVDGVGSDIGAGIAFRF